MSFVSFLVISAFFIFIKSTLSTLIMNEDVVQCSESQWFNLKTVNCSGRRLNKLPDISNDVQILDLSRNSIRDLTILENNTSIHTLILSENNLTSIEIPRLPNLKLLDLSRNQLSNVEDIIFKDSKIEKLNLSFNHIKNLKNSLLEQNEKLKILDLSTNPITAIFVLTSKSLEELYLNNIPLPYIKQESLIGLSKLRTLTLAHDKWIYKLSRNGPLILNELIVFSAPNCHMSTIDLSMIPKLEILNFSHNEIFKIENDSFKNNGKLYNIDLSNNLINFIGLNSFASTKKLAHLNLSGNKIKNLNWAVSLKNILNLNISHNEIASISKLKLVKVRVLDASSNKIESMVGDLNSSFPKITHLDLRRNQIKNIHSVKSETIEELNLSGCKIVHVDEDSFEGLSSLKRLNLSDNKIKRINFARHLSHLEELNLKENVWDCSCSDGDQVELLGNKNFSLVNDVVCEPDGLTWEKFCQRKEEKEKKEREMKEREKKLQMLQKITVRENTKKSSVDTGWLVGGSVVLVLILISLGWVIYRKRKSNRLLRRVQKKDTKPSVDLLEATPQVQQCYQYSFVYPPFEEVELRRTLREIVEPKYIDLQSTEETQSLSSQNCNRNDKE